ncbi:transcription antiterminator NusG [Sulfitobacter sp. JBTF-M27]|uniref:Transcription antiterminator NusG n=1 Tax=Sulfitobacter sediminilitoris TaxID=2698830 RepID=A0A6P0CFT4_9RHOB|nr:transcription termination/antitermination NusG family protein [Sulfitobacter sediminilitoris]NEK25051.1 transcription antiterminator NusG [Sulfitobacter sediminilitoris]
MKDPSARSWFVVQLRPQGLSRAQAHLHRQGFETFAPYLTTTVRRSGVQREMRKPLFPGYLFVSFDVASAGWTAINATRGVARLILNDPRSPKPLPHPLMAGLMARCDPTGLLRPPTDLAVGDKIRVVAGPFADVVTQIDSVPEHERVGILIDLMGRKVRTSLPRTQIEKLS